MNRNEIITKLVKEGFSEKTLIRFNDNQLKKFSDKILGEGLKVKADDLKADPALADKLKDKDVTVVPEEETMEPKVKKMTKKDVKEIASKNKIKRLDLKKLNEFVESVVDKKYHSLTTKGEISELVKEKIGASQISEFEMAEPAVKPDVKPAPSKPDTDTPKRERPRHPGQRPQDPNKKPLPDPVPKAGTKEISGDEAKSKIIGMIDKIFREN
jgi:hypothetical protein